MPVFFICRTTDPVTYSGIWILANFRRNVKFRFYPTGCATHLFTLSVFSRVSRQVDLSSFHTDFITFLFFYFPSICVSLSFCDLNVDVMFYIDLHLVKWLLPNYSFHCGWHCKYVICFSVADSEPQCQHDRCFLLGVITIQLTQMWNILFIVRIRRVVLSN